jgi:hypothetical protein
MSKVVTNQQELDKAIADTSVTRIAIDSDVPGKWLTVHDVSKTIEVINGKIEARGRCSLIEMYGSSEVIAWDGAITMYGNGGYAQIGGRSVLTECGIGPNEIVAHGESLVIVHGQAKVMALGRSTIDARESRDAVINAHCNAWVKAGPLVITHVYSASVRVDGGIIHNRFMS